MEVCRMVEDGVLPFIPERSHSVGNGLVEASIERSEFVRGDGRAFLNGQIGDRLAHVAVVVYDLIDGESESQQLRPTGGCSATNVRRCRGRYGLALRANRGQLLRPQRIDKLLQEKRHAMVDHLRRPCGRIPLGYSLSAMPDQLIALRRQKCVKHRPSI